MVRARRSWLALLIVSAVLLLAGIASAESGGIVESAMVKSSITFGTK